jgi:hypothetical protein
MYTDIGCILFADARVKHCVLRLRNVLVRYQGELYNPTFRIITGDTGLLFVPETAILLMRLRTFIPSATRPKAQNLLSAHGASASVKKNLHIRVYSCMHATQLEENVKCAGTLNPPCRPAYASYSVLLGQCAATVMLVVIVLSDTIDLHYLDLEVFHGKGFTTTEAGPALHVCRLILRVAVGYISSLNAETRYDPARYIVSNTRATRPSHTPEDAAALVPVAFTARTKFLEVLHRSRNDFSIKLHQAALRHLLSLYDASSH